MMRLSYWTDIDNNFLMKKVFKNSFPLIDLVDLFNISLDRDGPSAKLKFKLVDCLPDSPLEKWGKPYINFNKCNMGLDCFGVTEFISQGIETEMVCSVIIEKNKEEYVIKIYNNNIDILIKCINLTLIAPTVYLVE